MGDCRWGGGGGGRTKNLRDVQMDRNGYRERAGGGSEEEREVATVRGM